MFTPNPNRTFKRRVTVMYPSDTNEKSHKKGEFVAEFRQIDEERIEELKNEGNMTFLNEVLIGAHEIGDANGQAMDPHDEDTLRLVKLDSAAATATVSKYLTEINGKNAARKN